MSFAGGSWAAALTAAALTLFAGAPFFSAQAASPARSAPGLASAGGASPSNGSKPAASDARPAKAPAAGGSDPGTRRPAPNEADQIAAAVLAAPAKWRDGARVLAYGPDGLYEARAGDNPMVCLADDPKRKAFQVACYHRDLEPFMARGRALRAEGVRGQANRAQRYAEVEAGTLQMPRGPRTLHVLAASRYDPEAAKVVDAYRRWVIYIPFATPESTGLSTSPSTEAPWLMFPGTAGAHIMVTPPKPES